MPDRKRDVILIQSPERVVSFFRGEAVPHTYHNKFVVTESDRSEALLAAIGESRDLYRSVWSENGLTKNSLLGSAEVNLIDEADGQELVMCGGSLDYGGVTEAVARQAAERVKKVLQQGTAKEITVSVRDLVPPIHSCFFRGKLDGGR